MVYTLKYYVCWIKVWLKYKDIKQNMFFEPKYLRSPVPVASILYLSFETLVIMVCLNFYFTKF